MTNVLDRIWMTLVERIARAPLVHLVTRARPRTDSEDSSASVPPSTSRPTEPPGPETGAPPFLVRRFSSDELPAHSPSISVGEAPRESRAQRVELTPKGYHGELRVPARGRNVPAGFEFRGGVLTPGARSPLHGVSFRREVCVSSTGRGR